MNRIALDANEVVRLHFTENLSVKGIAERFQVSRGAVVRRIKQAGLVQRGPSDAMRMHMSQLSKEERSARIAAFHATIRGKPKPLKYVRAIAASQAGQLKSANEREIYTILMSKGFSPSPGFLVDRWLIDFAFVDEKIAVEIDGGNWHTTPRKSKQDARKTEGLTGYGWKVLRFSTHRRTIPKVTQDLISRLQELGINPIPF